MFVCPFYPSLLYLESRAFHHTLFGPAISSDYYILSWIKPFISEILSTEKNPVHFGLFSFKKNTQSGANALFLFQISISNLRALIEGDWSQTWIEFEGPRLMNSSSGKWGIVKERSLALAVSVLKGQRLSCLESMFGQ